MKQKQKIWVWLVLVSFLFSSVLPLGNYNTAYAASIYQHYTNEGIAFYAYSNASTAEEISQKDISPVYRSYSSTDTEHIYTTSEIVKNGYTLDQPGNAAGIAFYAYESNIVTGTAIQNIPSGTEPQNIPAGTEPQTEIVTTTATREGVVPVYQLYYGPLDSRLYTASETEKTAVMSGNMPYVLDSSNANALIDKLGT